MTKNRDRLAVAQTIARWPMNRHIAIGGVKTRFGGGGFGIFVHGAAPCRGAAPGHLCMGLDCAGGRRAGIAQAHVEPERDISAVRVSDCESLRIPNSETQARYPSQGRGV